MRKSTQPSYGEDDHLWGSEGNVHPGGSVGVVAMVCRKRKAVQHRKTLGLLGREYARGPSGVLELVQALWLRALFEAHRGQADTTTSTADAVKQLHTAITAMRDQAARLQRREVGRCALARTR